MKIDKIIVPLDYTEAAKTGLQYAISLGRKLNAHLILLNSYTVNYAPSAGASMSTMPHPADMDVVTLRNINEKKLHNHIQEIPELSTVDHTAQIAFGTPVEAICTLAEEEKADLIVIGTDGASEIEGFFMGTISEKVSRKAPCSVLVVPSANAPMQMDSIGLALDTEPTHSSLGLAVLEAIARTSGAKLRIIHIAEGDDVTFKKEDVVAHYKEALKEVKPTFHVFQNDDPKEGIISFLEQYPMDLLALVYREHGFFERLFQPGVRRKILFETQRPCLILK